MSDSLHESKPAPESVPAKRSLSRRQFLTMAGAAGAALAAGLVDHKVAFARPAKQDKVLLRAMTIGNPQRAETFEKVLGGFREANPNINLELVPVAAAEWDAYLAKIATILASGQQLDSVEVGTEGQQTFSAGGIIRPLDELATNDAAEIQDYFSDVNPVFIEGVMYQGSLYNLPNLWAAAGIYYNKKLFDQAGVAYPADNWTVEDFAAAASAIRKLGDDIYGFAWANRHWGGFVPWSFNNGTNVLAEKHAEGGEWLWDKFYSGLSAEDRAKRGGGYYWDASTANDPANIEALEMLQSEAFTDGISYMSDINSVLSAFETGKVGMIISHRAWVSRFKAAGLTPDDYDVTYMPMWKTQKHQYGASALAITTLSAQPDSAWKLMKYLTSKDVQFAYVSGGVHTATRRSVMADPKQHEGLGPNNWKAFYGMVDETDAAPIPAPAQNKDFTNIFTKYIGLAMANEMPAKDALEAMHGELNTMLGVS
ncbi:MAG: sugar ABC transporter substrate-binding protein [Anaerolineae bacterium]|nr:sugar ABC transporter substrate-binding protein [Anaerolineae bacterium]